MNLLVQLRPVFGHEVPDVIWIRSAWLDVEGEVGGGIRMGGDPGTDRVPILPEDAPEPDGVNLGPVRKSS